MGWKGGVVGGGLGYLAGLFFKSFTVSLITFKIPSLSQYLVQTFVPAQGLATPDFIRFFTVPLPFALMGAALGVLVYRQSQAPNAPIEPGN